MNFEVDMLNTTKKVICIKLFTLMMLLMSPTDLTRQWFEQNMENQFEISKQVNALSYLECRLRRTLKVLWYIIKDSSNR